MFASEVITLEVVMHRFVLAEFNTHRAFSRNSASSRAIPVIKQLARVRETPAIPLTFPAEQKGMQGGEPLGYMEQQEAEDIWIDASKRAVESAEMLAELGVHKSVTNRLLEPFMWHTVVVTSVEWNNFFKQRCSPLAQPEIHRVAVLMREAIRNSEPEHHPADTIAWHTPYIDLETRTEIEAHEHNPQDVICKVSAARCARVSYLTQDGKRDYQEDLALYERLVTANPPHWSPLEHVCRTRTKWESGMMIPGNLLGWVQLRHIVCGQV
jgi:thymidylate synthase ThyX